jgi:hypothetical protein
VQAIKKLCQTKYIQDTQFVTSQMWEKSFSTALTHPDIKINDIAAVREQSTTDYGMVVCTMGATALVTSGIGIYKHGCRLTVISEGIYSAIFLGVAM